MRQFLPPLRGNKLWQVMTKDILEASLSGVIALLSGDSHSGISNVLKAYGRLILKESRKIHVNQQKIKEA
jgi:hypothetical protein